MDVNPRAGELQNGLAMFAVSWAYAGWDYVCFASGEIRDPERTLPRAIVVGLLVLIVLNVAINLGYMLVLPLEKMQGVPRIAEAAMGALLGPIGAALVAAAVAVSCFGCNASSILPVSRVCYALSADRLFFQRMSAVHPRFRTPHVAIVATCAWSAFLTLTGTYEQLYTFVAFTALLFNAAGGLTIFTLRRTRPEMPRPYRVWGYPVVPAIFVVSTGMLMVSTLIERPVESLVGLALVALGLPAYWYWSGKR